MIPETLQQCARCGGPLINGWRIPQYDLPVCESCKISIWGEVVRHKPSATSNTLQDPSKPHLPFDLVREWRDRANAINIDADPTGAISRTYNCCAEELEANPTWKEAMKAVK